MKEGWEGRFGLKKVGMKEGWDEGRFGCRLGYNEPM